jgi:hypothetical protein
LSRNHLFCIDGILMKLHERVLFVIVIFYVFVITLVATRNPAFSYSKTFSTQHTDAFTRRRFGTTRFGWGIMGDYEGAIGGRKNNMKDNLGALAMFMEHHRGNSDGYDIYVKARVTTLPSSSPLTSSKNKTLDEGYLKELMRDMWELKVEMDVLMKITWALAVV